MMHAWRTGVAVCLLAMSLFPVQLASAQGGRSADSSTASIPTCSSSQSPAIQVTGSRWHADLSGDNNIKPNTTGTPMPLPGPSSGKYDLIVDEQGKKASWTLQLCDITQYVASHLHIGSVRADYPPPLIPLEPYGKPSNPFAPPQQLPLLCPPVSIVGCSYKKSGSFSSADIAPLAGRQPEGDYEVPAVNNWQDFLKALKDGKIYVNVHNLKMPAGLIRGNLFSVSSGSSSGPSSSATSSPSPQVSSESLGSPSASTAPYSSSTTSTTPSPAPGASDGVVIVLSDNTPADTTSADDTSTDSGETDPSAGATAGTTDDATDGSGATDGSAATDSSAAAGTSSTGATDTGSGTSDTMPGANMTADAASTEPTASAADSTRVGGARLGGSGGASQADTGAGTGAGSASGPAGSTSLDNAAGGVSGGAGGSTSGTSGGTGSGVAASGRRLLQTGDIGVSPLPSDASITESTPTGQTDTGTAGTAGAGSTGSDTTTPVASDSSSDSGADTVGTTGATTTGTSNDGAGVTQGGGASSSTQTADGNIGNEIGNTTTTDAASTEPAGAGSTTSGSSSDGGTQTTTDSSTTGLAGTGTSSGSSGISDGSAGGGSGVGGGGGGTSTSGGAGGTGTGGGTGGAGRRLLLSY